MVFFLYVLGMVLIIEGLPYLTFPVFMKTLLKRIPELTDLQLRLYGLVIMLVGLAIIALTHAKGLL
ncbi:DUF2065 domain-containing protein [bacterium]|nr:DUF2065 domain-containing protein [bacterium]